MTSSIASYFDIVDSKTGKAIFTVKATVTSVICRGNLGNPWNIELIVNSC